MKSDCKPVPCRVCPREAPSHRRNKRILDRGRDRGRDRTLEKGKDRGRDRSLDTLGIGRTGTGTPGTRGYRI